jgi:hypothetical protein
MNKVRNPLVGSDIEAFLMEEESGRIISAEGIIKGTKHKPFNFDPSSPFWATSLDNVLAEYCIAPASDRECFVNNINKSIGYIKSILPAGVCMAAIPSAILEDEFLQTANAKLFGCESDLNVWLRRHNPKPKAENENLRSAGAHVHVSYDEPDMETTEQLVKAQDLFLGVPSILLEPDNERRRLYGKAGAFRIKDYGFEYRTLSGFFASTDELKGWVFDNTMRAIDFINNERFDELDAVGDQIQAAINTNDKKLAGDLIRQFDIQLA